MFIVEMARGTAGEPGHETFDCSGSTWDHLLKIAIQFGWAPEGAVRDEHAARWTSDYDKCFKPTYEPEEWSYCKRLTDSDARQLSEALRRAQPSVEQGLVAAGISGPVLLRDDMSQADYQRVNSPTAQVLAKFADYASRGGFAFAWDD